MGEGGWILKLSNGGQASKWWGHFYGGSWSLKTPCKDFNLAVVGGLGWMKWLKNGADKSFLVKILLAKLKYLYIQYTWISIMKKQNSNQNGKGWKDGGKRKWHYSQNKDLNRKRYCQTLKAARIISSELKIWLILSRWCFSYLHIQRIGIQYTDQLFCKIIP